ncbi:TIM barrel protein [Shewanella sp. KT0246]|uniref:TIM barrel protein n=1 Tax=Shewanella sp. KT0246 TaxID=2815912 RepID=UPI001BBE19FA|nr:TIM barrel protein [Shewanella sp. KT0246]GIU48501.1 xylose isomerase [Shewanella sp. KT0246]
MKQLTNLTVTPKPGHLFENWQQAENWLTRMSLDGFEIYPNGSFNYEQVPKTLTGGFHLQSFPILTPLLYNDQKRLMHIFGDWNTVEQFYGGTDADFLVDTMVHQLNMAQDLGAPYAVFHPMDCDMDNIITQDFPWQYQDTIKACATLLNQALAKSHFNGWLLLENMWWNKSFRLDNRNQYDELRLAINYDKCGICFDTGHLMATQPQLSNEPEAIKFIENRLHKLDLYSEIITVHLNSSLLSQNYEPWEPDESDKAPFWQQFDHALKHINQLDPHQPFVQTNLSHLIDSISPDFVVHELSQCELVNWQNNIKHQILLMNISEPEQSGQAA